jgi:hypothetical protein
MMKEIRQEFTEIKKIADDIVNDCTTFDMPSPNFPLLDTLDEDIKKYEQAWSFYENFVEELDKLLQENWLSFR